MNIHLKYLKNGVKPTLVLLAVVAGVVLIMLGFASGKLVPILLSTIATILVIWYASGYLNTYERKF